MAPGAAARVSMAFARIALALVLVGRFETDHAAQSGGRVLSEAFAVRHPKLVEPRRNYWQGKRAPAGLTGSEHGHVELGP